MLVEFMTVDPDSPVTDRDVVAVNTHAVATVETCPLAGDPESQVATLVTEIRTTCGRSLYVRGSRSEVLSKLNAAR